MNVYTENILKDVEQKISQIECLSDWLESNSWEFASHTPEETFWLSLADRLHFAAMQMEKHLPF